MAVVMAVVRAMAMAMAMRSSAIGRPPRPLPSPFSAGLNRRRRCGRRGLLCCGLRCGSGCAADCRPLKAIVSFATPLRIALNRAAPHRTAPLRPISGAAAAAAAAAIEAAERLSASPLQRAVRRANH